MSQFGIHSLRILPAFAAIVLSTFIVASDHCVAQEKIDIAASFSKSEQCRIRAEIEHVGDVILIPDEESSNVKALPLQVKGSLKYHQRITSANQAIRHYDTASAKIQLDKGRSNPKLDDSNRLVIARLKSKNKGRVEMASVRSMLAQEELELLQTPADPLSYLNLFTKSDVKVGEKWSPEPASLAKFLNVHSIESSDVKITLKKFEKDVARVFVSGSVKASVFDVTTELSVSGVALIKVSEKQIASLKVSIEENRPAGQIEPGFEGRTRIDISFQHGKSTDELSNKSLAASIQSKKIQQRLKFVSTSGGYNLIYDPRWKLIAGQEDSAIMRFFDDGDLLSQCNVVLLPKRPSDQPLDLAKFKEEIAKAIGADKNATLVTAKSRKTESNLTAHSIVVAGDEDGLPVNWFYYHVAAKDGRQITFVFTLAESVSGRVKGAADQLVNEFQFTEVSKKVANQKLPPIIRKR